VVKMNGKQLRMSRITKNGKAVIIPMDHGTSEGPILGLENMNKTVPAIAKGGATAVLVHKGIIGSLKSAPYCGMIMHMSASSRLAADPNNKVLVASVEEAVILGADCVSVHINVGGCEAEPDMLKILGDTASDCRKFQMPLLAMMYPRGKNVKEKLDPEAVALVARIGGELGADLVKTLYTGDVDSFKKVVYGCPVPVVIAGGPKCESDLEVLEMVKGALEAGAMGVSLGRNAFQHKNPTAMVKALYAIIVDDYDVDYALEILKDAN
jgi:predicted phospho-2-dehydro-3-deoxyheptonate aldolase